MEHDDVVTLFHEFGHLLHHVLAGQQEWVRFSGVATEWDFVEAPSQMLEEWAWDAGHPATFATTNAAGEPIPADLVAKDGGGHEFGKGCRRAPRCSMPRVLLPPHRTGRPITRPMSPNCSAATTLFALLPRAPTSQASFGHLEGYSSAYYTYMWSLVIAKDLFRPSTATTCSTPEVAGRYRDLVLAPGRPRMPPTWSPTSSGRPYSFDTFGAWLAS
jgi:thimet oligopeptidase